MSIKVTIGILTYNHKLFITKCLRSVLASKHANLEIVVSDDNSNDNTFEILQKCILDNPNGHKIIINRNDKNIGLAGNFNKTFRDLATGDVLITLGGDDMFISDYIEFGLKYFEQEDVMMVDFNGTIIDEDDIEKGAASIIKFDSKVFGSQDYLNREELSTFAPGRMIRKQLVCSFPPLSKRCPTEDSVLVLRALLLGKMKRVNKNFIYYRRHSANISSSSNMIRMSNVQIIAQYLKDIQCALEMKVIDENMFKALLHRINYELKRRDLQYSKGNRVIKRIKLGWLKLLVRIYI